MPINWMSEIGTSGLKTQFGTIQDEFMRELRGKDGYKRYDEMRRNSPVVGALLSAIEQSIRSADWQFVSDLGEDDPRLEFLDYAMGCMSHTWNDHVSEALTMLPFGYSVFEIVYKRDSSGRLCWRKFAPRGQDTIESWEFDADGGLQGIKQRTESYQVVTIPIDKAVLYRTRVERNNPEGRSMLRNAWISYYYLKNIQQVEAIGIERDLAGLPVIKLPPGATTDTSSAISDASVAAKMVRNIRQDEQAGVVLPDGWTFELVSTGGSRQFDTDAVVRRYESRILMSALAQFLMLGQDSVGSLALSSDQTDFFTMSVNAIADVIAATFTEFAVKRLLELNGMDTDGVRWEHSPAGDVNLERLGAFLQQTGSMLTWTPADEAWLRQSAGLPEIDEMTILEERDRKDAALAQLVQNAQPAQQPTQDDSGDDMDEDDQMTARMSTDLFAARNRPDEAERMRWERRFDRLTRAFLVDQQKRVVAGARRLPRG